MALNQQILLHFTIFFKLTLDLESTQSTTITVSKSKRWGKWKNCKV